MGSVRYHRAGEKGERRVVFDGTDTLAFAPVVRRNHWVGIPKPRARGFYLSHPWPRRARRALYAFWAVLMALSYVGSNAIQGADRVTPALFAMACGWCAVGVVKVESWTIWYGSGLATFASYLARFVQIVAIELGWIEQSAPDSTSLASSAYLGLCVGSAAVWRLWLHPTVDRG
jgi:hypothetical protein